MATNLTLDAPDLSIVAENSGSVMPPIGSTMPPAARVFETRDLNFSRDFPFVRVSEHDHGVNHGMMADEENGCHHVTMIIGEASRACGHILSAEYDPDSVGSTTVIALQHRLVRETPNRPNSDSNERRRLASL